MAADANIRAVITAEDRASGVINGFGGSLGGLGKLGLAAGTAVAAVGAAVTAFGAASVKAFTESEDSAAQLQAVLKSTNGVAGVTADSALELASSLQEVTKFSDEAILGGENLLLTFTSIGKDIFPQATETMLNMSQALGQDVKSSAIQLGKALQDPILGVTALRRVGVNFSDAQQDVIKNLVETNQLGKAQALILKELQTEFGGSARAAGQTFSGQLTILQNTFGDLMEVVGQGVAESIAPFVKTLADFVTNHSADIQEFVLKVADGMIKFGTAAYNVAVTVWPILVAAFQIGKAYLDNLYQSWMAIGSYLATVFGPILQVVGQYFVEWILPALQTIWQEIQTQLMPALRDLWTQLGPILTPVLQVLGVIIGGTLIAALTIATGAIRLLVLVVTEIARAITRWIEDVKMMPSAIVGNFQAMVNGVRGAVSGIYDAITKPFRDAFNWIRDNVSKLGDSVRSLGGGFSFDLPKFATGVQNFGGGMAIVGERGPELVNLPRGSDVIPNNQIGSMGGSTTVNISINSVYSAGTELEKRKFANDILNSLRDVANSKNMSLGDLIS